MVDGWHVGSAFHDPMHVVFLGTCRDLYPSSMGYWMRNGFFGEGSLNDKLQLFSEKLKADSKKEKFLSVFWHAFFSWFLPRKLDSKTVHVDIHHGISNMFQFHPISIFRTLEKFFLLVMVTSTSGWL